MTTKIRVLNLYAGIGGNRKLWPDNCQVIAVEIDPKIAAIYQDFFPQDKVIITNAHEYLLDNYNEFDFIWSSPPCPTHSIMRNLKNNCDEVQKKYPDMKLYEEIIYLKHFFKGKYCVENVISYYKPLIKPQLSNNHYFWTNFLIGNIKKDERFIRGNIKDSLNLKMKRNSFDISKYDLSTREQEHILNNCVKPSVGLHIFNMAFKEEQQTLVT